MAPKMEIGESSAGDVKRGRGRPSKRDHGGGGRGGGGRSGGRDDAMMPMKEDGGSLSPGRSDSPGSDMWEDFPIPEFALILLIF